MDLQTDFIRAGSQSSLMPSCPKQQFIYLFIYYYLLFVHIHVFLYVYVCIYQYILVFWVSVAIIFSRMLDGTFVLFACSCKNVQKQQKKKKVYNTIQGYMFIFVSFIWLTFTASVASEIRLSLYSPDGNFVATF